MELGADCEAETGAENGDEAAAEPSAGVPVAGVPVGKEGGVVWTTTTEVAAALPAGD